MIDYDRNRVDNDTSAASLLVLAFAVSGKSGAGGGGGGGGVSRINTGGALQESMQRKRRRGIGLESSSTCWRSFYVCLLAAPMFGISSSSYSSAVHAFIPHNHQHYHRSWSPRVGHDATSPCGLAPPFPTSSRKSSTRDDSVVFSTRAPMPQRDTRAQPFVTDNMFSSFLPTSKSGTSSSSTTPAPRANDMSMSQMIAMNAVGGAMMVGVVYALASSNVNALTTGAENLEAVGFNIVDAALPMSATEVVTVTFSEAVAAMLAAAVSLSFSLLVRFLASSSRQAKNNNGSTSRRNVDDIQKAVGNGDFLLAQASALPLLSSMGVPSMVATTVGVLLAAIPAEIVKVASRKSQERKAEEDALFDYLLQQEEKRKKQQLTFSFFSVSQQPPATPTAELMEEWQKSMEDKTRTQEESLLVDIAADIIKWLGYSVLYADFSGQVTYNGLPLFPGIESAIFGIIASLSAQIYADILYSYFGFGGEEKQQEVRARAPLSWAAIYLSETMYAGLFFGIYEFAQIPVKASVSAFLSGGADACYGSQDFDVCLQAFESQNPPGASPEAQLRSLVTTVVSLWNRYTPDSLTWGA